MRRFLSLILALAMVLCFCACSAKSEKPADQSAASASQSEQNTVTGTVSEVKDFMFSLDTEDGACYTFNNDQLPEGTDIPSNGDKLTITYEGVLTEVDNFTGTIISVEKE